MILDEPVAFIQLMTKPIPRSELATPTNRQRSQEGRPQDADGCLGAKPSYA
jgi:hypothetical protein